MNFAELLCWSFAILAAIVFRFVGSWLGRRLGARHVLAWFGALTGFTLAVVLLEATGRSEMTAWDFKGVLAGCLIFGSITALCVEAALAVAEASFRSWRSRRPLDSTGTLSPPRLRPRDLVVTGIVLCVLVAVYYFTLGPKLNHRRARARVTRSLYMLATKRPEGVSADRWASCVGWTLNLHANCSWFPAFPPDKLLRFADELDGVIQGDVDMRTIDWIWDEYVRHARWGKDYSKKYRPTAPERLQ